MKIRTDFVTNSSSSSYCVEVAVHDANGHVYSIEVQPADEEQGGFVDFAAELGQVTGCKSVAELCQFLTSAITGSFFDSSGGGDLECDEEKADEWGLEDVGATKTEFTEGVVKSVGSVDQIAKIIVTREYSAYGEFAELVADNDEELCRLAKNVVRGQGAAALVAKAEMREYINTPSGKRGGGDFGRGFEEIRYGWDGGEKALVALAKRLCSNYGPGSVEGTEHTEIDMKTCEVIKYAEFKLE